MPHPLESARRLLLHARAELDDYCGHLDEGPIADRLSSISDTLDIELETLTDLIRDFPPIP